MFALYESTGGGRFVRVSIHDRYDSVSENSQSRLCAGMKNGVAPVQQLIVAGEDVHDDFPTHATDEELLETIRENNDMYP